MLEAPVELVIVGATGVGKNPRPARKPTLLVKEERLEGVAGKVKEL